jgi:DNA-binding SARP family transcriptional activator
MAPSALPSPAPSVDDDAVDSRSPLPTLDVHLLGRFNVFVDDEPVTAWPAGKARALFKWLVLQRAQAVSRERLMARFWPEADGEAARNSLNVTLHALRRAIDPAQHGWPLIVHRRGSYRLNESTPIWVDTEAFEWQCRSAEAAVWQDNAAAVDQALATALSVYRGPLALEDRFDDALGRERDVLQQTLIRLLHKVGAYQFDRGDYTACAASMTRLLETEPCDEEACRRLMCCHSRLGQVHLALRLYRDCVDALDRELKLIPSPQTVALAQQLRNRQAV